MSIACIVVATLKRRQLLDDSVMPSVVAQDFDECVVVGDYRSGAGWRHLPFPPLLGTTTDAQFKRDVGTLATNATHLLYLCDDHRLHPKFKRDLVAVLASAQSKEIVVPARFCERDSERIGLNMGWPGYAGQEYVGGHAGVFPRAAIQELPWSVAPWHPNWDFFHSRILAERGYTFLYQRDTCLIEDVEGGEPWL